METLYWIHSEEQTNPMTEGYIGITNDFDRRMSEHGDKFGTIKEVLHKSFSRDRILRLEAFYRPSWYIGENVAPGGQAGNRPKGIHTSGWTHDSSVYDSRRETLKGNKHGEKRAVETTFDGITFRSKYEAEEYRKQKYGHGNSKQVLVGNEVFNGTYECGKYFGISATAVRKRIKNKNFPSWKYK